MLRWLTALALVAVLAGAADAATVKRKMAVSPRQQFVNRTVLISGSHWPVGARCPGKVQLWAKPEVGPKIRLKAAPLDKDGSFRRGWLIPSRIGSQVVTVHAVEACGTRGTFATTRLLHVLIAP